jgi:hypothetical protein
MKDVPEFHVTGGRILASARDKAFLDKYLAEAGKPPIPIEVVREPPLSASVVRGRRRLI